MKLTKDEKKSQAKEVAEKIRNSPHIYFTQYQGLKFTELDELRKKLKPLGCTYKVLKNSTLSHALKDAGVKVADEGLLQGPNAVLFTTQDDPVGPAKVLAQCAKEFESLKVRAAYVGGQWMDPAGVKQLSTLGSRPELLSHLANALYSAVGQSAWVLAAPIRDFVLVLKSLEEKKKAEAAA